MIKHNGKRYSEIKIKNLEARNFSSDATITPKSKRYGEKEYRIFADTETIAIPTDDKYSKNKWDLILGYYELWEYVNGVKSKHIKSDFFTTEDDFMRVLFRLCGTIKNNKLIRWFDEPVKVKVFFHNCNFDSSIIKVGDLTSQQKFGYTVPLSSGIHFNPINNGMMPYMIDLFFPYYKNNDRETYYDKFGRAIYNEKPTFQNVVTVIDSMNFFPGQGLKGLMEAAGIKKPELPEATYEEWLLNPDDVRQRYNDRVKSDVIGLRTVLQELDDFTVKHFNTLPKITIGRLALASFARSPEYKCSIPLLSEAGKLGGKTVINLNARTPKYKPRAPECIDAIEAIKNSYKGGRTECFYKGVPQYVKKLYKYDLNSMYPSLMESLYVPIQLINTFTNYKDIRKHIKNASKRKDRNYLIKVDLIIPESEEYGFDGVKIKELGLCFPCGKINNEWLWKEQYEYAMKLGWIRKVYEVHIYFAWPIFKDYINRLYDLRKSFPKKSLMEGFCKLMMNSLYGKFGAGANGDWIKTKDDYFLNIYKDKDVRSARTNVEDGKTFKYYQRYNNDWYEFVYPLQHFHKNSVPQIASYICAMARFTLLKTFRNVKRKGGRVYYCDTDSMIIDIEWENNSSKLGAWKFEGSSNGNRCDFRCPKDYKFDGEWTVKGAKKGSTFNYDEDKTRISEQQRFSKHMSQLKKGNVQGTIQTFVKKHSGVNKKRNPPPYTDGWTTPLILPL